MRRWIAAILILLLLVPALTASAADEDYVLEIAGGPVSEHLETVDDVQCLKVEVLLHGATAAKKLSALYFALRYDSERLLPVRFTTASAASGTVNPNGDGAVVYAFASGSGVTVRDGTVLLTVWFRFLRDLPVGTAVSFALGDAEAESYASGKATPRTVGSSFAPFTVDGPVPFIPPTPDPDRPVTGTIEWNADDVQFKGTTAYVIDDGFAHTPRFVVKDENGALIDPSQYEYEYRENACAGTGYVLVTFKNGLSGTCRGSFKIYLPATAQTTVENTAEGIKLSWTPVEGAAGYVIYRRAWSSTTDGWTAFARWNNTTETTYLDGADASHKVYAGTRYQYGVKAYFARRLDPIANVEIGGNVNEPSGNYNLGIVGPLKTTVRITSRTLKSVTGGSKQLTVKWTGSAVFTGYDVQVATDADFTKNVKTVRIADPKTYETAIGGLKAKTTYYVRVRSYHTTDGMTYCGAWSDAKSAKTK